MNIVPTPCIIEVPSILTVAPNGIVKLAIPFDAPIFSSQVFKLIGIDALLLDVLNATNITGQNFFKKVIGFTPPKNLRDGAYTTIICSDNATETVIRYFSNGINAFIP